MGPWLSNKASKHMIHTGQAPTFAQPRPPTHLRCQQLVHLVKNEQPGPAVKRCITEQ